MSTEQTTSQDTPERTFHTTDYQRASRLLKAMRHVRSDPYTPKGPQSQAKVNALAALLASAFSQDAEESPEGAPFSAEYFMAGTQLPEPPQAGQLPDDTPFSSTTGVVGEILESLTPDPWDAAASAAGYDGTDTASGTAPQS